MADATSMTADVAGKRPFWLLSVLISAVPGASALLLAATGETLWAAAPILFIFGVIPILDLIAGEDPFNPTEEQSRQLSGDAYYRILLYLGVAVSYASFFVCMAVIALVDMPAIASLAIAFGVGVTSGGGLAIGHELGHKTDQSDRVAAFVMNALSGYGHFRIEHNRGHHVEVATPEDSASARMGESVWRFALREIPGGVARGWRHEAQRLRLQERAVFSIHNEILQGYAFAGLVAAALIAIFGWKVAPFIAIHHFVAWHQLTFANYVEHYGLLRAKLPNGRYEPCAPRHSWNSNHIISNLSLFHLQRHSDHHAHPMVPYQSLRNFPGLPNLPSGYPGCFLLALIPPLWFRVMNPKVIDWAGGDMAKINIDPHWRAKYDMNLQAA